MISFSSAISTVVWNGKHDGSGLSNSSNNIVRRVVNNYMESAHKDVYGPDGKWSAGDTPVKPEGIKTLTVNGKTDIWPSWFDATKNSGIAKETLTFNRYNHLLASSCTPEEYKIEIEVTKITDPMTGQEVYNVPEPYNREESDTCSYTPPTVSLYNRSGTLIASIRQGSESVVSRVLYIDDKETSATISAAGVISGVTLDGTEKTAKIVVTDASGYTATDEISLSSSN